MRRARWPGTAAALLAIGLAACINAALLYRGLRRHGIYTPQPGWLAFCLRLALALVVMGLVLWYAGGEAQTWLHGSLTERLLRLSFVVIAGATAYFATLAIAGFRLRDFRRRAAT